MAKRKAHVEIGARSSVIAASSTFIIYFLLTIFGYLRDTFGKWTGISRFATTLSENAQSTSKNFAGFPPLIPDKKGFYIRRIFTRFRDCFDRPICSSPGARIDLLPRTSYDNGKSLEVVHGLLNRENQVQAKKEGVIKNALNLGSYNYLGFGDNWTETCGPHVLPILEEKGIVATSSCLEAGYTTIHEELEKFVAKFLHKESALVFSMGYGTNATVLTSLLSPGSVVLSDSLNHTSIINGCRGADKIKIIPFKHNNLEDMETVLKRLLICGRSYPQIPSDDSFTPWSKIVVVVEGIYSMEGECCDLEGVRDLCKKYKAYLYVDEAHSIGALGKSGRGICEHSGVDFADIDILMGTFSKSFGGMGGYVAGDKITIDKLRASCSGQTSMSPLSTLIAKQVLTAFEIIDQPGGLGQQKINALKENSNYFRNKLRQFGLTVLGDEDSPVIPMMIYHPTKVSSFSNELLKRNIAGVVVAFPATSMYEARARFCMSAGHDKEDLRQALKEIADVAKMLNLRYEKSIFG